MNNFLKTLILSVLASNYLFAATMCPSEISFNQGKLYYKNGKEITDWRQDYFNVPINNEKSTWEKLYPTSINAREQRGSGASIHWSMHCEYATEEISPRRSPYVHVFLVTNVLQLTGNGWKYWYDCRNKKNKTDACLTNAYCQTYTKNNIKYTDYEHCTAIK